MIGEEFKKQLINEGINPDDVSKFVSKYDKNIKKIVTTVTMEDNSKHTIMFEPEWYAARKNKKW